MTHIIYSQLPLTDSFGLPLRINGMHRTQSDLMRIWTFYLLQFNHTGFDLLSRNAPINVELVGGTAWGGGWPCGTGGAFDRSCSPGGGDVWIFLHLTWGHLTTDSDGNHEGHRWGWKQGKLEWIWLFCLHISFYLRNLTEN